MSELHFSPDTIRAMAEAEAQNTRAKAEKEARRKLEVRAEFAKKLSESDILNTIRYFARQNYENTSDRLLNPHKRREGESADTLIGQVNAHKIYVELFDTWNKEGESAMKKLMEGEG